MALAPAWFRRRYPLVSRQDLALVAGSLVVGAVLIWQFGAPGAVAMVLLDRVVGLLGHYLMVSAQVTRQAS